MINRNDNFFKHLFNFVYKISVVVVAVFAIIELYRYLYGDLSEVNFNGKDYSEIRTSLIEEDQKQTKLTQTLNVSYVKVNFDELNEFNSVNISDYIVSFNQSCKQYKASSNKAFNTGLNTTYASMLPLCENLTKLGDYSNSSLYNFFKENFEVYRIKNGETGKDTGLVTGYYLPEVKVSCLSPTKHYEVPVYSKPSDLLTIKLANYNESYGSRALKGRLDTETKQIYPYYTTEEIIGNNSLKGKANIIAYLPSLYDLYNVGLQGSAFAKCVDTGEMFTIAYSDKNGWEFTGIGSHMRNIGLLKHPSSTNIKEWLAKHPKREKEIIFINKSFVFFQKLHGGPYGTFTKLTPMHSAAVDPRSVPYGLPMYIEFKHDAYTLPNNIGGNSGLLLSAQDTGGVIKGEMRADLYWGNGDSALNFAGNTYDYHGRFFVFIPKNLVQSCQFCSDGVVANTDNVSNITNINNTTNITTIISVSSINKTTINNTTNDTSNTALISNISQITNDTNKNINNNTTNNADDNANEVESNNGTQTNSISSNNNSDTNISTQSDVNLRINNSSDTSFYVRR